MATKVKAPANVQNIDVDGMAVQVTITTQPSMYGKSKRYVASGTYLGQTVETTPLTSERQAINAFKVAARKEWGNEIKRRQELEKLERWLERWNKGLARQ